jgi:hypothetical protein
LIHDKMIKPTRYDLIGGLFKTLAKVFTFEAVLMSKEVKVLEVRPLFA